MKHLASIALTAALTLGGMLSAALPAASAPFANPPSTGASNIILVQEHGTRRYPNDERGPYWRDYHHGHDRWRERRWERRHWDNGWRDDRRYHHRHHGGVMLEIRP